MSNFNKKQQAILNKEFKIDGALHHSITRDDFESFPCPMLAWNWTDEQMETLAKNISLNFDYYEYPTYLVDELEDEFYSIIEKEALDMGMKYYDDLTEEEFGKQKDAWNNIK